MLRMENVTKRYPSGVSRAVVPLKDLSIEICQGERILILGKSGSGKSTFLNILGGVDLPTSGRVFFGVNANKPIR